MRIFTLIEANRIADCRVDARKLKLRLQKRGDRYRLIGSKIEGRDLSLDEAERALAAERKQRRHVETIKRREKAAELGYRLNADEELRTALLGSIDSMVEYTSISDHMMKKMERIVAILNEPPSDTQAVGS
jgi:hypothetical protein